MRGRLVTELKLVARDESDARRSGAVGANTGPQRYVEINLTAPLRLAEAPKTAAAGGRP
jgi:hypothetical protein